MASLSGDCEHHTVGEPELGSLSIVRQCCLHDVWVLKNQIAMAEQHLNGHCDLCVPQAIHGI